ncbi:hypothetical protein [Tateyamaria sp. syn59]|uniref:hypothetical protein n=1 Tax=Tateyamaria sp. syn59 TaxID=2576942 RepID=UPI0011BE25F5|nr:hypothetical protein [Tateyamaria sp. syn59]
MDDAEHRIDEMNAEMQAAFLEEFGDPAELLAQPGLQPVLDALAPDYTTWQRAFWLVSPEEFLDRETPLDVVQAGEIDRVVRAAWLTREIVIG